jgi:hypothetical protein
VLYVDHTGCLLVEIVRYLYDITGDANDSEEAHHDHELEGRLFQLVPVVESELFTCPRF